MKINEYRLNDFAYSEKAIWLVGRWSYPRLETRYKNHFIPKSQIAIKDNHVFIPDWLVQKLAYQGRTDNYKFTFPYTVKSYDVPYSQWNDFLNLYGFEKVMGSKMKGGY